MKRALITAGLMAVLAVSSVSGVWAAEHGGHEHGGASATAAAPASGGMVTPADLHVLQQASDALKSSDPALSQKLLALHHKLSK